MNTLRCFNKKMLVAATASVVLGMGMAGQAQATHIFYQDTVTAWFNTGGVMDADGDSFWKLTEYGGRVVDGINTDIDTARVTIAELEIGGQDIYTITLDFTPLPNGGLGPNEQSFWDYTAQILPPSTEQFVNASLDSDVPAQTPDVTVNKEITDGFPLVTLTSISGLPDGPKSISGQFISVHETFVAGQNGYLAATTDTYVVPEPGTVFLLGGGLAGLAFAARRRAAIKA